MFSFLSRGKTAQIILADAFQESLGRIAETEERLSRLQANPLEHGARHITFSNKLGLRLEMATAADIKKRLERGQTQISLNENQTLTSHLLGRQATNYRIYDRDFEQDRACVMGNP